MSRRLPPLNALRAFEAAARHLSFTRAAGELHVTQTAISHQIKALEERLGVPLFRRLPRGLLLTEEAQRYLPPVRDAFDQIAAATDRLARDRAGILTVSVLPSFAAKWLVPRLARLRQAHPELELRIVATPQLTDFVRDDVDVGIRMGRGHYPGLRVERLFGDTLFPVCSPQLLEGPAPLRVPEDLRHHLLLAGDEHPDWAEWLRHAGVEGVEVPRGPLLDDSSLVLQAAVDGQGVALTRASLAAHDLAAGRLIKPFELALPFHLAYYLVAPEATADQAKVKAFRDWILAEVQASEARPAQADAGAG